MDQYNKLYYITAIHCKSVDDFFSALDKFTKDEKIILVCNESLASDYLFEKLNSNETTSSNIDKI